MSEKEIKISARAVVALLSGSLDYGRFRELYSDQNDQRGLLVTLAKFESRGLTISDASVEKCPEEDDDWLILRFAGPDPAAGPSFITGRSDSTDE